MMFVYFNALDSVWRIAAGRNPAAGITLAGQTDWLTLADVDATLGRYCLRRVVTRANLPELPHEYRVTDA